MMRATLMGCVIATKKYLATIYVVTTSQSFLKCYLMLLLYSTRNSAMNALKKYADSCMCSIYLSIILLINLINLTNE